MHRQLVVHRPQIGEPADETAAGGDDADAVPARDQSFGDIEHAALNAANVQ